MAYLLAITWFKFIFQCNFLFINVQVQQHSVTSSTAQCQW